MSERIALLILVKYSRPAKDCNLDVLTDNLIGLLLKMANDHRSQFLDSAGFAPNHRSGK